VVPSNPKKLRKKKKPEAPFGKTLVSETLGSHNPCFSCCRLSTSMESRRPV
jgi:hypothetical protein